VRLGFGFAIDQDVREVGEEVGLIPELLQALGLVK
jgi:hypothetical protein